MQAVNNDLEPDDAVSDEQWRDEQVFTCPTGGYTLVTSRKPDDLFAFETAHVDAFARA